MWTSCRKTGTPTRNERFWTTSGQTCSRRPDVRIGGIKRQYCTFLKEAKRHSEATVDAAADALARFETATKHRAFKAFHFEQAVAFKNRLGPHSGANRAASL